MGIKVLFLYPNTYGMNMVPPAIALFSAILKKEGHQVQIFDTTYYQIDYGITLMEVKWINYLLSLSIWEKEALD